MMLILMYTASYSGGLIIGGDSSMAFKTIAGIMMTTTIILLSLDAKRLIKYIESLEHGFILDLATERSRAKEKK